MDQVFAPTIEHPQTVNERRNVGKVSLRRNQAFDRSECLIVNPTHSAPALDEFVEALDLRDADASHDVREMIAESLAYDVIVPGAAVLVAEHRILVHAQQPQPMEFFELLAARRHHRAAVDASDNLDRIEAEAGNVAVAANPETVDRGAECVAGVLHHAQIMPLRQLVNRRLIARYAREVQRNDRFGPVRDKLLGLVAIDSEVVVANVAHHRRSAVGDNRLMVRHVIEGSGDDFVPRPDPGSRERDMEGGGAGAGRDHVPLLEFEDRGDALLELFGQRAHTEPADVKRVGQVLESIYANVRYEYGNRFHRT